MEYVCGLLIVIVIGLIVYTNDKLASAIQNGATATDKKVTEQAVQAEPDLTTGDTLPSAPLTTNMEQQQKGTRDLFLETLKQIGCQYDISEGNDDRIHFAYQGEHFLVAADNEHPYIGIWDYAWGSVELHDIDEVSRLRKAINEANWQNSVTTVFTIDNTGKTMDVHCKATILFVPQIPSLDVYLRTELNEFFHAHQLVGNEMVKLREKEAEST